MILNEKDIRKEICLLSIENLQNPQWRCLDWDLCITEKTGKIELFIYIGNSEGGEWRVKTLCRARVTNKKE